MIAICVSLLVFVLDSFADCSFQLAALPGQDFSNEFCSFNSLFCVLCDSISTGEVGVINFGKFEGVANPGCNLLCWPFSSVKYNISMRLLQLDVECETKTKVNNGENHSEPSTYTPFK